MRRFGFVAFLVLVPLSATLTQQNQTPPCQTPEYRQFDFWIGTWDVYNPNGQQVGVNTISSGHGGCTLHESYRNSAGTYEGNSYNIYDRSRGVWHQTWVDNGGLLLRIEGGMRDGAMVLSGETIGQDGNTVLNRITWTPFSADSIQQLWETSSDGGSNWATAFDGRYVKR